MSSKTLIDNEHMVKILVIGDCGVGKTNLITRYS